MTYTLVLMNASAYTDTFIVQITSTWSAVGEPVWIGPLAPHATVLIQVSIKIPIDAVGGSTDNAVVVATSLADKRQEAESYLTTIVVWDSLFLPLVQK